MRYLVLLTLLNSYFSYASGINLDTHIHIYHGESFQGIQDYMNRLEIKKGFVLASSFMMASPMMYEKKINDGLNDKATLDEINPLNRFKLYEETSDFLASTENMVGLCGVNLDWEDLDFLVNECLKLPKMIGLKIHDSVVANHNESISNIENLVTSEKPRIILWHPWVEKQQAETSFTGRFGESMAAFRKRVEEAALVESIEARNLNDNYIGKILDVIVSNPQHTFIIAHAFEHLYGLQSLIRIMKTTNVNLPSNLYFDIALYLPDYNYISGAYEIALWREIGTERFLFGSDFGYATAGMVQIFYDNFLQHPLLSETEKSQILFENGDKFWNDFVVNNPNY